MRWLRRLFTILVLLQHQRHHRVASLLPLHPDRAAQRALPRRSKTGWSYISSFTFKLYATKEDVSSKSNARFPSDIHDDDADSRAPQEAPLVESPISNRLQTVFSVSDQVAGLLVLVTVPMVWGTYVPVVRTLYFLDPPVPGFLFSACYFALASATAFSLLAFQNRNQRQNTGTKRGDEKFAIDSENSTQGLPFAAGLELGSYLFLGNSIQLLGLKTVPADRAGFLVQLTTIFVPLVSAALAGTIIEVPGRTWGACALAMAGITVMGLDFQTVSNFSAITSGDGLIIAAALMYTMHVVRLGRWAESTSPLELVASKTATETVLSVGLVSGLLYAGSIDGASDNIVVQFAQESGREISAFLESFGRGLSDGTLEPFALQQIIGAVVWAAWVTTVYVIYAQSFGQARVKAADANLVYSLQPIFTALFAFVLLGETMEPQGVAGGVLILSAVYLVASKAAEKE